MIPVTRPSLPELDKYTEYLKLLWKTKWITNNGELTRLLEQKLKEHLKVEDIILVSNGTIALQLALRVSVSKGEVITTPFTFIATTNAILWEGYTPVFADINPDTYNIDPEDVAKKITKKTRAILAVHVYGNPSYAEELETVANEHDVKLIFDGAHSFGVEYRNQSVFNFGEVSTLSFHATKVFNTIEGGALTTKNRELAKKLRLLRDHGIKSTEEVDAVGTNAKMNEFQAAMGLCNLEHVNRNIELRKRLYERYVKKLGKTRFKFQRLQASKYNYAYIPVCFENQTIRDRVHHELSQHEIGSRKYFYPLTTDSNYFKSKKTGKFRRIELPVAANISSRVLCLPLYPDLSIAEVDGIAEIVKQVVALATNSKCNS